MKIEVEPDAPGISFTRRCTTPYRGEMAWAKSHISKLRLPSEDAERMLIVVLGGAYELIFQSRRKRKPISTLEVVRASLIPFAMVLGYSQEEIAEMLENAHLIWGFPSLEHLSFPRNTTVPLLPVLAEPLKSRTPAHRLKAKPHVLLARPRYGMPTVIKLRRYLPRGDHNANRTGIGTAPWRDGPCTT